MFNGRDRSEQDGLQGIHHVINVVDIIAQWAWWPLRGVSAKGPYMLAMIALLKGFPLAGGPLQPTRTPFRHSGPRIELASLLQPHHRQ